MINGLKSDEAQQQDLRAANQKLREMESEVQKLKNSQDPEGKGRAERAMLQRLVEQI